jgi:hypothetical protein
MEKIKQFKELIMIDMALQHTARHKKHAMKRW